MIELLSKSAQDSLKIHSGGNAHAFLLHGSPRSNITYAMQLLTDLIGSTESVGERTLNHIEIQPNERGIITKKDIDELLIRLQTKQSGKVRVITIKDAETMHISASNALLKMLEEPGDNTKFILSTTRLHAMPDTVLSRLQHIALPTESTADLQQNMKEDDASLLLAATRGNMYKIDSILNDPEQKAEILEMVALAKNLLASDVYERIIQLKSISKDRLKLEALIDVLLALSQSALHATAGTRSKASQWATRIDQLLGAKENLDSNVQPRLVALQLMVQL